MFWWKEALIVAAFYGVYSWTRNLFGSNKIAADGVPEQAFTNAERVIGWELDLNLFHEQTIQSWFLPYHWFIQFWNTYYGTAHFIVTLGVFVLLFLRRADVFPQWRNSLAAMTALAIIGFAWSTLLSRTAGITNLLVLAGVMAGPVSLSPSKGSAATAAGHRVPGAGSSRSTR